jgi:hypothetical protein
MTTLREAAQQALEALEELNGWESLAPPLAAQAGRQAAINLRAALEQPEQDNFPEEKLQAVAEYFGDKYHVWYGIGARDVEEVLHQSVRRGLVTLNFDTGEQPEQEPKLAPAPGWCKHCRQYTVEEPLPAQPEQEPVAWMRPDNRVAEESTARTQFSRGAVKPPIGTWVPLYTHPPRREWRGLTEEEIRHFAWNGFLMAEGIWDKDTEEDLLTFARAIEQACKERNP